MEVVNKGNNIPAYRQAGWSLSTSCDFVENHLIKKFAQVKIERILIPTSRDGIEYTTRHKEAKPKHKFERMRQKLGM